MPHRITRAVSAFVVAALAWLGGAAGAQAATELQFWHAMDRQVGEAVVELVGQFNQSQGQFEVKALYKGTYPEVLAAAIAAYRQKAPPHIVQVSDVGTLSMVLSDAKIPVYRLMQREKMAVNWADFIQAITGYYSRNGRLYSMPFNASTPILYYNKAVFGKAGLGATPPATWREVEAASKKILAAGAAVCGFTTGGSPSWSLLENTFSWHGQPFATNQNGYTGLDTKLLINSAFGRMHIGALARWHQEHIFVYGGREGQGERFANGDCAMAIESSGSIGRLKRSLTFDWETGQLPHWGAPYPKQNTIVGGATLWVPRGHEPADERGVAQFLKFITEPRQQKWWAAATGYVPITRTAVRSLEDDAFYQQNPEQWTAMSQLLNAAPTPNSQGLRLGNFGQVRQVIELELENILAGKKTVKDGLDAAVARGNAILRQFGVTHGAAPSGAI